MILNVFWWYLIIALAGWLAFPLAYRMLAFLPDRGLAFSRPFGLLLGGYAYWLLVSFHILQNDLGGVFFALLVVLGLSVAASWNRWGEMKMWLRQHLRLILTTELLFLVLFAFWAVVRAANPELTSTEKPMELAFINAILRSPAFPPADPWLSGYGISYYYFGYVIVAMLARLAAVPGSVAFNLALATWFALTGLAAYGLVYNLLAGRRSDLTVRQPYLASLLSPLFVLLVSNLEGFLELLHSRGLFWQAGEGGYQSGFWKWLNILEINTPPAAPFDWSPVRPGIWWWRASRVLQDFDWAGQPREIIDEFPAFSYNLGDLHPHVLAMPFVLLAVVLSLNIYLRQRENTSPRMRALAWVRSPEFWLCALVFGGLSFLNTWDFPIYLALFAASAVLPRALRNGLDLDAGLDLLKMLVLLGFAGVGLYLPFYLGFASQANGLMPSLIFFTRGVYFWVMFGSLLLPILAWLIWKWRRHGTRGLAQGFLVAVGLVGGLWLFSSLFGMLRLQVDPSLASVIFGAPENADVVLESIIRRFQSPGAWLSLIGLLSLTWGLFSWGRATEECEDSLEVSHTQSQDASEHHNDPFVLLLILLGLGLILFPEFFYLRDQFGSRMNTIFKFYFQAWIVLAISAAFASAILFERLRLPAVRLAFTAGWTVLLVTALAYPFYRIPEQANDFNPQQWSLDGARTMMQYSEEELEAVRWLQTAPYGVVAEATSMRASYTGFARVSTLSGLPTVLGWPGHEMQWRGGAEEIGTREPDIAQLYKARTWDQISAIIEKYNIRYIYVGGLEQSQYRTNDVLFRQYFKPVFERPSVIIYEVPRSPSQQVQANTP